MGKQDFPKSWKDSTWFYKPFFTEVFDGDEKLIMD